MIKSKFSLYYWPITIVSVILITATVIIRLINGSEWMEADNDVLVNYLQVISTIYAIVIGFVLLIVWGQFVDAEKYVGKEAGYLQSIRRLSGFINLQEEQKVRKAVAEYINETIDNGHSGDIAWKNLYMIVGKIGQLELKATQRHIFADMLDKLEEVITCRQERLALSNTRIPWPLWTILCIVTISLLIPFCLISVKSIVIHLLLIESTVASSMFFLALIYDLDHPIKGILNISFDEMSRLLPDDNIKPEINE